MPATNDHDPRARARFLCDTAGSILSIHVRGEIDHHTASEIRRGIDGMLFEKRPKKLILDLSSVSFMDSSGLGLIMGRYSVMKELDGEMVVWNPSPEIRSILTLAGMERMVRIEYPAEGQASVSGQTTLKASAPKNPPSRRRPESRPPSREAPSRDRTLREASPRKRRRSPAAAQAVTADGKEKDA